MRRVSGAIKAPWPAGVTLPAATPTMLRFLFSCCLLGLALAEGYGYDNQQTACTLQQETLTVTNTHVETAVKTVTVQNYLVNHQVVDVTSVVLVPSPLAAGEASTPLAALGVLPTTTLSFTTTLLHTSHTTVLATAVSTSTTHLVATQVDVVATFTLTQTGLVEQPVVETHTFQDLLTAVSTVTEVSEAAAATVETVVQYSTVTATSVVVVPVAATTTAFTTTTAVEEATVTLTQHEFVTLCYSPKITYDH